jgi:alpha-mannosidase
MLQHFLSHGCAQHGVRRTPDTGDYETMNRRSFLRSAGADLLALSSLGLFRSIRLEASVPCSEGDSSVTYTNWADPELGATATASSTVLNPPWGYMADSVFGNSLSGGWQTNAQTTGAWIEVKFAKPREVEEVWIFSEPVPTDILGQNVYMETYPRVDMRAAARRLKIKLSSGSNYPVTLLQTKYFQIFRLPRVEKTNFVRIEVDEVWPKAGATETGLCKIRVFQRKHAPTFEITAHTKYDVQNGQPVQAATVDLINPGEPVKACTLRVSRKGELLMRVPLQPMPACAQSSQPVWIPALFEDASLEFEVVAQSTSFSCKRELQIPKYHSYFDGGTYDLLCTNHNDLGWLNTQALTADYRSEKLILPALELMRKYPEFLYSMESTTYLMEFLERNPEKRDEMAELMRQKRFTWGASYVQLLPLSAGPEKLVRQFYFGRRWLKKTFPGVDTRFYIQSDPPCMSLQMPQILAKSGIKYCLLGRLPFGYYEWKSPDGTKVFVRGFRYSDPSTLLNPIDNSGWLQWSQEREDYYKSHHLPRMFVFDYTSDYLPPQPQLVPYAKQENSNMAKFAAAWNAHFAGQPDRQIAPPKLGFTTPEAFLDKFTAEHLNIPCLYGDWPLAWAYYDEPSNREALLKGRLAHNDLLAAERLYAGLGLKDGFGDYPKQEFEEAWKANIWPDHGWGGNRGIDTDRVYSDSYAKSKSISESILRRLSSNLVAGVQKSRQAQIPVVVFNQLSWARTEAVECDVTIPDDWAGWALSDDQGQPVPFEVCCKPDGSSIKKIIFFAEDMPPVGYKCYFVHPATDKVEGPVTASDQKMENDFFRVSFGHAGIKSLYDKRNKWEVLRTDKFFGGEVLQFHAAGNALEETEAVDMQGFDRTANHDFPLESFTRSAVRTTATFEAKFKDFTLRERFHLYDKLERVDVELEIVQWNGKPAQELRVAFPVNLDDAHLSYEVPFGTVEIGRDELDFSGLPSKLDSNFLSDVYGGAYAVPFREAINWVDAFLV